MVATKTRILFANKCSNTQKAHFVRKSFRQLRNRGLTPRLSLLGLIITVMLGQSSLLQDFGKDYLSAHSPVVINLIAH